MNEYLASYIEHLEDAYSAAKGADVLLWENANAEQWKRDLDDGSSEA